MRETQRAQGVDLDSRLCSFSRIDRRISNPFRSTGIKLLLIMLLGNSYSLASSNNASSLQRQFQLDLAAVLLRFVIGNQKHARRIDLRVRQQVMLHGLRPLLRQGGEVRGADRDVRMQFLDKKIDLGGRDFRLRLQAGDGFRKFCFASDFLCVDLGQQLELCRRFQFLERRRRGRWFNALTTARILSAPAASNCAAPG